MPEWIFDPARDEERCAYTGCPNAATMLDGEEYICTGHDIDPRVTAPEGGDDA